MKEYHGTLASFVRGCRCNRCAKVEIKHGNTTMYRMGCRCDPCVKANRAYAAERRRKRRQEREALKTDTKPIETEKYRDLVKEALKAFSTDPGYVVDMCHAAASASSSPHAQFR